MILHALISALFVVTPAPPPPEWTCYVRDVDTGECWVWRNTRSGKFYDRYGNPVPDPFGSKVYK